ncbi:MAG: porin [Planctomycetota bacterium]|nr:porin [Planctomycetota bacterium]
MNRLVMHGCIAMGMAMAGSAGAAAAGADEVRALVAEMMRDAEGRASLLRATAGGAGHDGVFFIESPDGDFRLEVTGFVQFRYGAAFFDDDATDEFEGGFEFNRNRLTFQGHVFSPALTYKVTQSFRGSGEGNARLSDAYVEWAATEETAVTAGQFKLPFLREELASAKRLLASDRSTANSVFTQGRSQGAQIAWGTERVSLAGAFSDGLESSNTAFTDDPADWAVTGRAEAALVGSLRDFREFRSPRGSAFAAMIGAAAHAQGKDDAAPDEAEALFSWTADLGLRGDGWHVFAAYMGREIEAGGSPERFVDQGVVAQGSMFVSDTVAPFARWDVVLPDGDREGDDPFNTVTLGANWYIHGHAAKLTVEARVFLDDAADNDLVAGIDALSGGGGADAAISAQFQIIY